MVGSLLGQRAVLVAIASSDAGQAYPIGQSEIASKVVTEETTPPGELGWRNSKRSKGAQPWGKQRD